ncbi:MAG TPA: hypothetical protein VFD65_01460 [Chitinophagales bacterium]|nr:hypothetical protein [Chitinophagales bacterium]
MGHLFRKYTTLICCILLSNLNSFAGGEYRYVGTRSIAPGLGGVSTITPYAPSSNQAAMGFAEHSSISLYYAHTGLTEGVNSFMAMAQFKMKKGGSIGFSGAYFGYSLFSDRKIGIAYGLQLADFVSIGAQIDLLNNHIAGYSSNSAVTFEIGTLFKIGDHIQLGAHVYNPPRVKYGKDTDERVPTVFRLGVTYTKYDKIWITGEVEQDLDLNLAFRTGIDYKINEYFFIRAGVLTYPLSGTLGVGIPYKSLRFELSGSYQKINGVAPHLGISYVF